MAILGKRLGVRPDGWEEAAGKFGDDEPRSVADITDPASLAKVREWKKAQKAAKRDKQDRPLGSTLRRRHHGLRANAPDDRMSHGSGRAATGQ